MEIRGMRWGYDGGGIACGPVEGSSIVELCLIKDDQIYFVAATRMSEFEHIFVSDIPVFDILMHMSLYGVDFEHEFNKVQTHSVEDYDYEIGGLPEEMEESEFAKAIQLARLAMHKYYVEGIDEENEAAEVAVFIKEYLDKELESIDLPEIPDKDDEEE